jgi:hypothetical protein
MSTSARPPVALPAGFRTALITQFGDFRRAELTAIYRYGHLNHGNVVRLVARPGGHADEIAASFRDALAFVEEPGVTRIRDRFEDGDLGMNVEPAGAAVGGGWSLRRGTAREERIAVNGASQGVLRLVGDGAEVASRETVTWRDPVGITLDARLRAESATATNQRITLHVVPAGDATAENQPGLHLTWGLGEPSRAEIVGADGMRRTLATWTYTSPHPMTVPATVTSPQAGEGVVPERMFWDATAAPDHAGAALRFRGDDLRLVLSEVGFQFTLQRPASALTTPYAGRVTLQTAGEGEDLPVVIQGFWSEVEPAVIAALPAGPWRLVLTNARVDPAAPVGDALVDEVRVVAR